MTATILTGDALEQLATLPDESVHCCVTSPPYYKLRDYGTATWIGGDAACEHKPLVVPRSGRPKGKLVGGTDSVDQGTIQRNCHCGATRQDNQIGLEDTPDAYVARLVAVFREVRRVLRQDGTCWVNLGMSYAGSNDTAGMLSPLVVHTLGKESFYSACDRSDCKGIGKCGLCWVNLTMPSLNFKTKDEMNMPHLVAMALQADGWHLRQTIIWHKPNPMPESVTDRCTKAHEYIFLLTKSAKYWYDADAIRTNPKPDKRFPLSNEEYEARKVGSMHDKNNLNPLERGMMEKKKEGYKVMAPPAGANKRSVWSITTKPYKAAHFATFPPELPTLCIKAGCPVGGTVLDPFAGAGTTGVAAQQLGRSAVLIELNPDYVKLIQERLEDDAGGADIQTEEECRHVL